MNTSMDNTKIMADKFEIIEEHRYAYLFATPPYLGITNHRVFLQVNACGNQQPRTMVIGCNRPHGLNDYLLIYLHRGCGTFQVEGVDRLVQEGSIICFRPHEAQIIQYLPENNCLVYWIHFTGSYDESLLKQCGLHRTITPCGKSDTLASMFITLFNVLLAKETNFEIECVSILLSIAAKISRMIEQRELNANRGKFSLRQNIRKVMQILETQYDEHWTVSDLAEMCCVAPNYLIASFKKQTGFTPIEYLNHIRIRKADELLAYTDLSIKEIAHQSGYDDPLYFSRRYSSSLGISPTARRTFTGKVYDHDQSL